MRVASSNLVARSNQKRRWGAFSGPLLAFESAGIASEQQNVQQDLLQALLSAAESGGYSPDGRVEAVEEFFVVAVEEMAGRAWFGSRRARAAPGS